MKEIHICSFSALENIPKKEITYERIKEAALKAGRFSCFEASETARIASIFTRLCRDPEIETFDLGYPWTGIRFIGRESA